jgi:hypothetical protein
LKYSPDSRLCSSNPNLTLNFILSHPEVEFNFGIVSCLN